MSKGIVMFAHNNEQIDYLRLAVTNAYLIQKHMGLTTEEITIVTDEGSYEYAQKHLDQKLLDGAAQYIMVYKDKTFGSQNLREYRDTAETTHMLPFHNGNRSDVYELSPYDETLLIDCDYLILSDALNQCWGHVNDLMMNWDFKDIMPERSYQLDRFNASGITMYWATVIYFRKTPYAESLFEIVKHVKENLFYYKDLYKMPGILFRNDYAFSIAAHMLSGFKDKGLPQLPVRLYKTFDFDDVEILDDDGSMVLMLDSPQQMGRYLGCRWEGIDLHIMNKWAINRIGKGLIRYAKKK